MELPVGVAVCSTAVIFPDPEGSQVIVTVRAVHPEVGVPRNRLAVSLHPPEGGIDPPRLPVRGLAARE